MLALGVWWLASTTLAAEEPEKSKARAPERLVITGDGAAGNIVPFSSVPLGRISMAQDSSGTIRRPDERRMITGSFIPQKVDVYGNVTTASVNLRLYDQGDLRTGVGAAGKPGSGSFGASYTDTVRRVGNRYILDLRTITPARRLEVATGLLGPERGRRLVADFDRWQAAQSSRSSASIARR